MKELNWLSASQLIISHSLKLIHKVSYEMLPPALTQYLYHSMVRSDIARYTRKPSMTHKYLSAKTKNGFFHRSIYIYNQIDDMIRLTPSKKFNKEINKYISNKYNYKEIPKITDDL